MTDFFVMVGAWWSQIIDLFDYYPFEINGVSVSLPAIWFAVLVVGLVITIFWKGSRT